jgi:hypothetical protein
VLRLPLSSEYTQTSASLPTPVPLPTVKASLLPSGEKRGCRKPRGVSGTFVAPPLRSASASRRFTREPAPRTTASVPSLAMAKYAAPLATSPATPSRTDLASPVGCPCTPSAVGGAGHGLDRAAGERNRLESRVGEEAERGAVRREEGPSAPFGPGEGLCVGLVEGAQVDDRLPPGGAHREGELAAVR